MAEWPVLAAELHVPILIAGKLPLVNGSYWPEAGITQHE